MIPLSIIESFLLRSEVQVNAHSVKLYLNKVLAIFARQNFCKVTAAAFSFCCLRVSRYFFRASLIRMIDWRKMIDSIFRRRKETAWRRRQYFWMTTAESTKWRSRLVSRIWAACFRAKYLIERKKNRLYFRASETAEKPQTNDIFMSVKKTISKVPFLTFEAGILKLILINAFFIACAFGSNV